jgi:hypothetical protein
MATPSDDLADDRTSSCTYEKNKTSLLRSPTWSS